MPAKHKKKVNKGFSFKTVKFVLAAVLTVYIGYTWVSQQIQLNSLKSEITELDSDIAKEEKRKQELEEKKKQVNTPEYIEKIARDELDLVAPDEIVFMEAPKNKN